MQAQIYDDMKNGKLSIGKASSDLLINFDEKVHSGGSKIHFEGDQHNVDDELGRIKRPRSEDVHSYYGPHGSHESKQPKSEQHDHWEWSRGDSSAEDGREVTNFAVDREYVKYIEDRVKSSTKSKTSHTGRDGGSSNSSNGHNRTTEPFYMSESSRVKSQWEKTLHGESRSHLESVHRETEAMRSLKEQQRQQQAQVQRKAYSDSSSVSCPIEGVSGSGGNIGSSSKTSQVVEDRRELLRRKQLERKMQQRESKSSDVGSGDANSHHQGG